MDKTDVCDRKYGVFLDYRLFTSKIRRWVFSRLALPKPKLMRKGEKLYGTVERGKELSIHISFPQSRIKYENMRRWLELLKDYDTNIQYHPGKANVVADALSRKSGMIAGIKVEEEIIRDLERLDIELCVRGHKLKKKRKEKIKEWLWQSENIDQQTEFRVDDDGILWQGTKLCVPEDPTLREALMTEAHSSPFSIHPGSTKMYHDLKQHFWWSGMKRDVATFVSKCLTCQQVKIEHQRASGAMATVEIPVCKWDRNYPWDFVTGLPRTQRKHDAIWVVVDRLTKSAHFLPIRKDYPVSKLAEMFQQEIVRLHGTPSAIVSDRDPRFTSRFWKKLKEAQIVKELRLTGIVQSVNRFPAGPFEILDRALVRFHTIWRYLLQLSMFTNVFHLIITQRFTSYHPLHVASYPFDQIREDLSYTEEPESILDRKDKKDKKKQKQSKTDKERKRQEQE
ncbi:retrotransposon protein, putative, ty3-gypsy subclass [Tanacetum coccineum]